MHNEAFNVGASAENYRIRELAEIVEEVVPGARAVVRRGRRPGQALLPGRLLEDRARPARASSRSWTVRRGVEQLHEAYVRNELTFEEFTGTRYLRINRVRELQEAGRLDDELRWRVPLCRSSGDDLHPHPARGRVS